jgi:cobalt/nickel transport system permease protein
MINIDRLAYLSKLKQTAPIKKVAFSMLTLGVCLWADSIAVSILTCLMMGWWIVCKGGIPFGLYRRLMLVPLCFIMIGVLTIVVNISGNKDIFIISVTVFNMQIGVSQSGVHSAMNLLFKTLGAVSCLYCLSLTTPIVDLLGVLRMLKVPKLMVELMGLTYRFIFVLLETADTIFTAQHSRLGYSNLSSGYRSLAALASTLFIRSYKSSIELYTALEARGYDGELSVLEEKFKTHWTEYIPIFAIDLFLVLLAMFLKQYTGGLLK